MAKARGVLGNDPFQRGAAARNGEQTPAPSADVGPGREEKKAAPAPKKPAAKKAARPTAKKQAPTPPVAAEKPARKKKPSPVAEKPAPIEMAPEAVTEPTVSDAAAQSAPETTPVSEATPIAEATPVAEATPIAPAVPSPAAGMELPTELRNASAPRSGPSVANRAMGALSVAGQLARQMASIGAVAQVAGLGSGALRAIQTGIGTSGATELDPYGKDPRLVEDLEPLRNFIYERYWRVTVEGAEKVPTGPVLLVANHSGAFPFDGPILQEALRRERGDLHEARWLVEDQVFYAPFVGTLLNRIGAVRACPENALRMLGEARPVIVFPEGIQGIGKPFRERYRLMRFGRGGLVKIALKTRAPIVPVAIVGAEESMPLLGKIPAKSLGVPYVPVTSPVPLPARWSIRFGEPISVEAWGPDSAFDLPLVQSLNDRTRESIQEMVDAILRERTSVFA